MLRIPVLGLLFIFSSWVMSLSSAQGAVVLVVVEAGIAPDGTIDWTSLGPNGTVVPNPFSIPVTGIPLLDALVSQTGTTFERRDQSVGWAGDFAPGEALLWTDGPNGPITFDFDSLIQGFGVQIQSNFPPNTFTAEITAFDSGGNPIFASPFVVPGLPSGSSALDTAPFVGVLSTTNEIDSVRIGVIANSAGAAQDFAINSPRIQIAPQTQPPGEVVPEPSSIIAWGLILAGALLVGRRPSKSHLGLALRRLTRG
jgi:hypothetical protein